MFHFERSLFNFSKYNWIQRSNILAQGLDLILFQPPFITIIRKQTEAHKKRFKQEPTEKNRRRIKVTICNKSIILDLEISYYLQRLSFSFLTGCNPTSLNVPEKFRGKPAQTSSVKNWNACWFQYLIQIIAFITDVCRPRSHLFHAGCYSPLNVRKVFLIRCFDATYKWNLLIQYSIWIQNYGLNIPESNLTLVSGVGIGIFLLFE